MGKLIEAGAAQNDCTAVARVRWVPEREKRVEFRDLFVGFRGSPPWAKTRSTKSHQAARKKAAKSIESHTIALVVFALPVRISLRGALSPFVTTEPKEKQWCVCL
jgi:hypothetical protein